MFLDTKVSEDVHSTVELKVELTEWENDAGK